MHKHAGDVVYCLNRTTLSWFHACCLEPIREQMISPNFE